MLTRPEEPNSLFYPNSPVHILSNKKNLPGEGLFSDAFPHSPLTADIEKRIISYLAIQDIINCMTLNKHPWECLMEEEFKRRKNCVTVYTWPSAEDSKRQTSGSLGHSALKTYGGNENNKGIYISFYPGDCNGQRHINCHKKNSHFHPSAYDNQDKENKLSSAKKIIDIYGLDVNAIHEFFSKMHDGQMNSKTEWGYSYNCSDVVLKLLMAGGVAHYLDLRQYGVISKTLLFFLGSEVANDLIYTLHTVSIFYLSTRKLVNINKNLLSDTLALGLAGYFKYKFNVKNPKIINLLIDGLQGIIGGMGTFIAFKLYALTILSKFKLPFSYSSHLVQKESLFAALLNIVYPFIIRGMSEFTGGENFKMSFPHYKIWELKHYLRRNFFPNFFIPMTHFLFPSKVTPQKTNIPYFAIKMILYLSTPLLGFLLYVYFKSSYDKISTPESVLKLINQIDKDNSNVNHFRFFYSSRSSNHITAVPVNQITNIAFRMNN